MLCSASRRYASLRTNIARVSVRDSKGMNPFGRRRHVTQWVIPPAAAQCNTICPAINRSRSDLSLSGHPPHRVSFVSSCQPALQINPRMLKESLWFRFDWGRRCGLPSPAGRVSACGVIKQPIGIGSFPAPWPQRRLSVPRTACRETADARMVRRPAEQPYGRPAGAVSLMCPRNFRRAADRN